MEESQLVVAEKYEFEKGAKKRKVAILGKLGLSEHWYKVHKSAIFPSKIVLQQEFFFYATLTVEMKQDCN